MAIDLDKALSLRSTGQEFTYTDRDTMLYALGVGMGADPMNRDELPFVYENGLKVLPTQATVIAFTAGRTLETGINFMMVVHGEQRLTVHKPLPDRGTVITDWRLTDVIDKGAGKGAVLVGETVMTEKATGDKLVTLVSSTFARADGGFGGPSEGGPQPHPTPTRAPDAELALPTRPDQALLYRLSGDRNPLHSDPDLAKAAGFPRPILHGLCTYGVTCRAVLQTYCAFDPTRIVGHDVRFSSPVFPGETIVTRMWKDGNIVSFEASVLERPGVTVIKNGKTTLAG
ncbi:MAG: MaoC/PaaZ C-terminal domain-containing protein [Hyphomonadaceae bacterium]|nr:MaoC/PaaZ C-terminal domain-containing protein [Hyphomonadaceae bacterium]